RSGGDFPAERARSGPTSYRDRRRVRCRRTLPEGRWTMTEIVRSSGPVVAATDGSEAALQGVRWAARAAAMRGRAAADPARLRLSRALHRRVDPAARHVQSRD